MIKKEFKVYSPLTAKSVKEFTTKTAKDGEDTERIMLEGIASTTSRDLHDEIVSADAIDSMAEQALALNIHGNHWYGLEDVIGAIKDADVEDNKLHIKFLITKKYTPDIKDLLDTGVNLGLSIGGYVTNYDEKNRIINAIELYEISLTPMPANWDTFGTVTTSKGLVESNCLSGACYAIVKTLDGESNMETKEIETHKEEESSGLTQDDVIQIVNEYMAEKEETIAQEITEKVESQLESIVEAKIAEALDEDSSSEEEEETTEETKATEEENEEETSQEEEEEDEEEKTKSNEPTIDVVNLISESVSKALGEDFEDTIADKVAEKMFGKVDQTRSTKGSKYEQFQKSLEESQEEPEPVEKTTYSTKETAQILLAKQKTANPIMGAVMKNLE